MLLNWLINNFLYLFFPYFCITSKSCYGMKCRRNEFLSNIWKSNRIKWTKLSMFYLRDGLVRVNNWHSN